MSDMAHDPPYITPTASTGSDPVSRAIAVTRSVPDDALLLIARLAAGGQFFKSGLVKYNDFFQTDAEGNPAFDGTSSSFLAQHEWGPKLAAWGLEFDPATLIGLAMLPELIAPVFLAIGLFTRLAALPLIGMTIVIQTVIYPLAWDTHLLWASALLFVFLRGPGAWSLDNFVGPKITGILFGARG